MGSARRLASVVAALLVLSSAAPAAAHASSVSRGVYQRTAHGAEVELVFARADAALLVPELDRDGDGGIDERELSRGARALMEFSRQGLLLRDAGEPCVARLERASLSERDGVDIRLSFRCARSSALSVTLPFLTRLAPGHRHLARREWSRGVAEEVLFGKSAHFELSAPVSTPGAESARRTTVASFVKMGCEHILSGLDHVAFLFALLLGVTRLRPLLRVISGFTLAHSLTLALVVLGVCAPPAALVEPAIALSVAYVGVENLREVKPELRWRVASLFGLVHGLGFASALTDAALPPAALVRGPLSFNVGVELGQLLLVALMLPGLLWIRRRAKLAEKLVPLLSLLVVVSGLCWLALRCI